MSHIHFLMLLLLLVVVVIDRVNGNDRGTQVNPNITFEVTDRFNRKIGDGVVLRVGDFVRFLIKLALDGKSTTFSLSYICNAMHRERFLLQSSVKGKDIPGNS